jgi:nuclear cap-binding protein subunit 2
MRGPRATVERLDQPSAYFNNRVSFLCDKFAGGYSKCLTHGSLLSQNKRRRFDGKDQRDADDDVNMQPDQPEEDPLKDATTLYVGNLYAAPSQLPGIWSS